MRKTDKKELEVKKLVLSKETIRLLNGDSLQDVIGGLPKTSQLTCDTRKTCTGTDQTCSCGGAC